MITREMSKIAKQRTREFPVLTITGPRQSGKTTKDGIGYRNFLAM